MEISETTWVAITAVATCVLTLATIALAIGVPWSMHAARIDARNRFYAQLDGVYMEIQSLIIQTPHLGDARATRTTEQMIQYDAFAFIVWNFVESIYDYSRQDASVLETWKCIFIYESKLHRDWFDRPDSRTRFKTSFVQCIVDGSIR
jgi:hypothetical protein